MKEWVTWQYHWSTKVQKLEEIESSTGITPKALSDKPQLFGWLIELADIYRILSSRRSIGFSENPIPLSEIVAYVALFGSPSIPVDIVVDMIGIMDSKYLELKNGDNTAS